jgi:Tfp pilus assembly protein PilF
MVYPAGLAVFYPYPYNGRPPWEIALAGMLLISLSAVALQWRRKEPWLLVGWCWYLVMLLPVVGIIQAGEQAHADRYKYLPQIGIYLAVTWQAAELRLNRVALGGLMTGVIVLLAIYAWKQTAYWKDSETLWTHTLASTTRNDMAHNNLGTFLLKKGRVDEAAIQFQAALQIKPNDADSHYNLGTALLQQGRVDDAIAQFQTALQLQPDDADAHYNLATAFRQEEKMDEAITHYRRALQIQPDNAGAHYNLALALRQEGKVDEAITHYEKALQIQPDNADAHNNLGNLLLQKGRIDEAIFHFQKALEINPGNAKVHNNLGNALLHRGRVDEAIAQIQQALQLDPANPAFLNNLEYINKVAKTKK